MRDFFSSCGSVLLWLIGACLTFVYTACTKIIVHVEVKDPIHVQFLIYKQGLIECNSLCHKTNTYSILMMLINRSRIIIMMIVETWFYQINKITLMDVKNKIQNDQIHWLIEMKIIEQSKKCIHLSLSGHLLDIGTLASLHHTVLLIH